MGKIGQEGKRPGELSEDEKFETLRGKVLEVVQAPWGKHILHEKGEWGALKTLHVNPKARTSDQSHQKRSEHWAVVQGRARVFLECDLGEEHPVKRVVELGVGETITIPLKAWHRLENPDDKEMLVIVEQISGLYDEKDIKRRDDDYGRANKAGQ